MSLMPLSDLNAPSSTPRLSSVPEAAQVLDWRSECVRLRQAETEAHERFLSHLQDAQRSRSWKERGHSSLKDFCRRDLKISAVETRQILREMGLILPANDLKSDVPNTQARIEALRFWRTEKARGERVAAYRIFSNRTLLQLAELAPRSFSELIKVPGIGPAKQRAFGEELVALLNGVQGAAENDAH